MLTLYDILKLRRQVVSLPFQTGTHCVGAAENDETLGKVRGCLQFIKCNVLNPFSFRMWARFYKTWVRTGLLPGIFIILKKQPTYVPLKEVLTTMWVF